MYLLGIKNTAIQEVIAGGAVTLGSVYRRYTKPTCYGQVINLTGNGIELNANGIYHLTIVATVSAAAAGDVILQLVHNSNVLEGATATETITTADTEFRTLTIDFYIKQDCNSTTSITLINSGTIDITISNLVANIEKVI